MTYYVTRYSLDPEWRASDSFHSRPFTLQFLLALDLFAFSHILEFLVYLWPLLGLKLQFRQPTFIVYPNGSAVIDGLLNIVGVHIFSKNSWSRSIRFFYWSPSEPNE